ncbi:xylulokinase [Lichenicoccus sp.]|uniref:xylulokinase n=1 Tax=Lichenicoccus sp. TaxID=2781899 RepID=UPI003D0E5DF6
MSFLGIDLGTSNLKAVLVDDRQQILGSATVPLATARPHPGWSEQAPEDWWQAVLRAVEQLHSGHDLSGVRAIGLSGQMHGLVLLDRTNRVLRPAILWNDSRAAAEAAALALAHPAFAALTGAAQSPSFWPAKLSWLRHHEPDLFAQIARLLPPKDYIRLKLTGRYQTDPCDAGGTLLFDAARHGWSEEILAACGIARAMLPDLVDGNQAAGVMADATARALGLPPGIIVAGGGGDAATNAIGIGAVADGDTTISLGTSAQIFVSTDAWRPAPHAGLQSFAHALPERWFQAAAVLNGASALAWAARLLGADDPEILLQAAEAQYQGPASVLFLPYLTGERAPHNDPDARGVLFGLTPDTAGPQLVQAVIEGVAFSLADALDSLAQAGTRITQASLVGGGARSAFWTHIIADVIGIPLVRHGGLDIGPAFGAARLARLAFTGERFDRVCVRPPVLDRTLPDAARRRLYAPRLERYRVLYQTLRPLFTAA